MPVEKVIETDVLVIGGGMSGCFTAIKAREHVDSVTIVDKGFTGKSGATHFAEGDFTFLNHEAGHDIEAWLAQMNQANEYLNDQQWCRILLEDSHDRYNIAVRLLNFSGSSVSYHLKISKSAVSRWISGLKKKRLLSKFFR
jgi:succinate dehydrogenase/fumarate reductase flavoprotein subunit